MARIGISPVMKFYDSDGTVLASGTVETYLTNTATPKNSYTSAAGAGTATSFTLDSNGEAVRYFDTDAAYKLIIKDSGGTTVRTIDPYVPVPGGYQLDNDLDVNGNSIISTANADITIAPNGTGNIILDNHTWPNSDGTVNQVLKTDGAGVLSWASITGNLLDDTSPQLSANLDTNSYNIQFDTGKGLLDDSNNEQLLFTKTTSAVNYINMTNAITGSGPILASAGSDTNIDININAKGSGAVNISGISYPTADGTANQVLATDGAGTVGFYNAEDVITTFTFASQSDMETATSTTDFVSPGVAHYHPGVVKAWVVFQIDGTIDASYRISSVTDSGVGDFTVNFTDTFSSANYCVLATPISTSGAELVALPNTLTTTGVGINVNQNGSPIDPSYGVSVVILGDL